MAIRGIRGGETTARRTRAHVDALDGVRAVAIAAVLACHLRLAGVPFRAGGYLGVDIFFVLSGFLITSLLIDERYRRGRVSLANFMARRFLRIMPLLAVLVAIGVAVFVFAPAHYTMRPESVALVAAPGAWMNWLYIIRPQAGGMLAHTWSLSVELQFYVVFPLLLLLAWRARWHTRTIVLALVGLTAAVVALRMHTWWSASTIVGPADSGVVRYLRGIERGRVWSRWYFGSLTHADGLLLGALLAFGTTVGSIRDRLATRPRLAGWAAIAALAVVGTVIAGAARAGLSGFVPLGGLLVLELAVAGLLACMVAAPQCAVGRLLGSGPMAWVGRRSYAMYLLHIPVWMLVLQLELGGKVFPPSPSIGTGWLTVVLTLVAAEVAFRLVERPAALARRRFSSLG